MKIREIRGSLGLSQSKFAKKFHINISTLQNWEQGRRQVPDYVIYLINKIIELENK